MYQIVPHFLVKTDLSAYALYVLMFLVGIGIGADRKAWEVLKQAKIKIVLVPLTVIALISNISREIFTLLATPFLVKYFGTLAPIASGGATSMDTTLPIITKFLGKEYAIISVFSGVVLTILVPFLVTFILKF